MQLVDKLCNIIDQNHGCDIHVSWPSNQDTPWECVIIATANSYRHMNSLRDKIVHFLKHSESCLALRDGEVSDVNNYQDHDTRWLVVDAGNVLVHLFDKDSRGFYQLESLWKELGSKQESYIPNSVGIE